jgi:kinesin family protein 1
MIWAVIYFHSLTFLGFNCSLFAYGQTGSGKSYSMIGYGANRYDILCFVTDNPEYLFFNSGIAPIACDELFQQIENKKASTIVCNLNYISI